MMIKYWVGQIWMVDWRGLVVSRVRIAKIWHGTIQSIGSICRIDAESDFKEAKATILRKLELQLVSDIGEEYISKYSAGQANQT